MHVCRQLLHVPMQVCRQCFDNACMYAGGATAIIASQADPLAPWAGFSFVLVILVASAGQTVIALIVNNLHSKKRYPTYWFGGKL